MAKCEVHRRVEYAETDMAGIVHFSEFSRYMESAEHELFRRAGLSVMMQDGEQQVSWPRVACAFEFKAPLRFEDEMTVSIWIADIGGKSVTFRCEILCGGDVKAVGTLTSVCCLIEEGGRVTSMPIPDAIREKLDAFLTDE
ncbi:MAG: thioesterase family protein [Kiritimatiellae bacterium]|nr:thioesterase family protein [Kiritimatiellia bacterium]